MADINIHHYFDSRYSQQAELVKYLGFPNAHGTGRWDDLFTWYSGQFPEKITKELHSSIISNYRTPPSQADAFVSRLSQLNLPFGGMMALMHGLDECNMENAADNLTSAQHFRVKKIQSSKMQKVEPSSAVHGTAYIITPPLPCVADGCTRPVGAIRMPCYHSADCRDHVKTLAFCRICNRDTTSIHYLTLD